MVNQHCMVKKKKNPEIYIITTVQPEYLPALLSLASKNRARSSLTCNTVQNVTTFLLKKNTKIKLEFYIFSVR